MKWVKRGKVFSPNGQFGWINSHAQVPTVLDNPQKETLRIYFSTRPRSGMSLTTFVDVQRDDPLRVTYVHNKPILDLGGPGTFDEFGIMPSSAVMVDGKVYLYYSGWARGITVPYSNYTGLAVSKDGGFSFKKISKGPVLDRTPNEIYSATSPCVKIFDQSFHMWYCSGVEWHLINGKYEHTYDIKHAVSDDGIIWHRELVPAIPQNYVLEAITKPTVHFEGEYCMWYCFRGSEEFRDGKDAYRLGFAKSKDLRSWVRKDTESGIETSKKGWDSKMIAYPEVIFCGTELYMFYNGNSFGKEGFGLATYKSEQCQRG